MHFLNTVLVLLFASSSLVAATPVIRRDVDNIVWVTVTSAETITSTRRRTRTVTYSASLADPPHRAARNPTTTTPVEVVATSTPAAAVVAAPVTTSTTPVPVVEAAPTPSTTPAAPTPDVVTPTISAVDAAAAPTNVGTGTGTFSGQGTFYSTGLGSCGVTSADTDYICAISHGLYDSIPNGGNPNNSPFCGRTIKAYRGSKSVVVTVVDRCEGCQYYDLDFSPSAFDQIAQESEGRVDITWEWLS